MDEQLRETCDRFIRAEAREQGLRNIVAKQSTTITEQASTIANLEQSNAEKDAEIARLNEIIVSQNNAR